MNVLLNQSSKLQLFIALRQSLHMIIWFILIHRILIVSLDFQRIMQREMIRVIIALSKEAIKVVLVKIYNTFVNKITG